jgi:hypothetical protein
LWIGADMRTTPSFQKTISNGGGKEQSIAHTNCRSTPNTGHA